jgi:hypothetical protein
MAMERARTGQEREVAMKEIQGGKAHATRQRVPAGRVLDEVPKALYVLAHVMFLAIGIWLWAWAAQHALPYLGALALYVISQVGFLAYFANVITMKTAVLVEQMAVVAMLILIILLAT